MFLVIRNIGFQHTLVLLPNLAAQSSVNHPLIPGLVDLWFEASSLAVCHPGFFFVARRKHLYERLELRRIILIVSD